MLDRLTDMQLPPIGPSAAVDRLKWREYESIDARLGAVGRPSISVLWREQGSFMSWQGAAVALLSRFFLAPPLAAAVAHGAYPGAALCEPGGPVHA